MITPTQLNKIINKIFSTKEELKTHKVELNVMDEIQDALQRGFGMEDFIEDEIAKARIASMRASDGIKFDMNDAYSEAEQLIDEADKALKELGAESSQLEKYKNELKELDGLSNDLKRRADQLF